MVPEVGPTPAAHEKFRVSTVVSQPPAYAPEETSRYHSAPSINRPTPERLSNDKELRPQTPSPEAEASTSEDPEVINQRLSFQQESQPRASDPRFAGPYSEDTSVTFRHPFAGSQLPRQMHMR